MVFINADYAYPAEYIQKTIDILEENPGVGMVTGNRFNHSFELRSMKSLFFAENRFLHA